MNERDNRECFSEFAILIVWIVENGELVKWERTGECNGCGECCRGHEISFQWDGVRADQDSEGVVDYSSFEGWSSFKSHGLWWWFRVTSVVDKETQCGCLVNGKCEVWKDEVEFPPLCRYFPVHPDNLEHFPKCGFSFRRL